MRKIKENIKRYIDDAPHGSATVEFVISLPLILIAFVFVFEFSQLFWAHHTAANNTRSAVRYLSRAPLAEPFLTRTENIAKTGDPADNTGPYEWMAGAQIDIDTSFTTYSSADFRENGQIIRVQTDVPYNFVTFNMLNGFSNGSVDSALTFRIIEEARYIGE